MKMNDFFPRRGNKYYLKQNKKNQNGGVYHVAVPCGQCYNEVQNRDRTIKFLRYVITNKLGIKCDDTEMTKKGEVDATIKKLRDENTKMAAQLKSTQEQLEKVKLECNRTYEFVKMKEHKFMQAKEQVDNLKKELDFYKNANICEDMVIEERE